MFMEGPDSIRKPSINLSTQIGAAKKVSENSASVAQGKGPQTSGNGATVSGSGIDGNAAGQALLEMMANNIVPTNGLPRGSVEKKGRVGGEATIETHAAAFLADGPEANGKFQKLMQLASRGTESSSGKASPGEIELGKQAVISLDGADAQLAATLRSALSLADRQKPVRTEDIIESFHNAKE